MQKFSLNDTVYKLRVLAVSVVLVLVMQGEFLRADNQQSQFSYNYKTEVAFNNEKGVELPSVVEQFAHSINKHLNTSIFFDTSFIVDTKRVRAHHLRQKPSKSQVGQLVDFVTQDGALISCTYFDRGSDTLLLIGEGFTNDREKMTPFVDMFDCDIVLFDLRGQGYRDFKLFDLETWPMNLAQVTFGMDSGIASLGLHEEKDVFAVVDGFRQRKNYKAVNGVSVCYSSFVFLKAEAMRPGLFNKIVVDGCWLSLDLVIEKIKADLKIIWDPQNGGLAGVWPLNKTCVMDGLEFLARNVWGLQLNNLSALDYVSEIKDTPVLLFYGKDDLMVYRDEFEQIWNGLATKQKTAVITSNPHVRNHLKQKEVYKMMCDLFFDLDQKEFMGHLNNINDLVAYQMSKLLPFVASGNNTPGLSEK